MTGRQEAIPSDAPGQRRRILVAEDELLVALDYEDMLHELGCAALGPARAVSDALALARYARLDGAILDIRLIDGLVFPVAQVLRARKVPFCFITGYRQTAVPEDLRDVPIFAKPVDELTMALVFREMMLLAR